MVRVVAWTRLLVICASGELPALAHLSHGVGDAVVGDAGWARAVGGVRSDDLGSVNWRRGRVGGAVALEAGRGNGNEAGGGDSETHVDGVERVVVKKVELSGFFVVRRGWINE